MVRVRLGARVRVRVTFRSEICMCDFDEHCVGLYGVSDKGLVKDVSEESLDFQVHSGRSRGISCRGTVSLGYLWKYLSTMARFSFAFS